MKFTQKPFVIIGGGIAGLYTAIKLSEKSDKKVLLITKTDLRESNSRYAQGGIVGVLPENTEDSISRHVKDTLIAGAGLSNEEVARFISEKSNQAILDLISYGVEFDTDKDKKLELTIEGAHSIRRILHSGGDATGKNIELALSQKVENDPKIDIYKQTLAVDLLIDAEKTCKGVIVLDKNTGEYETIYSSNVILATGGAGQVYSNTTNPALATGDGIALAYRAGAVLQNMEFTQFHPTALNFEENGSRFLISESVRGEGAIIKNPEGEEFTDSLAPRDIVTRAILFEMQEKGYDHVLLNISSIPEEFFKERFPNILNTCLEHEIDVIKEPIPISPAAHYIMGGIKTSVCGETSIEGLYAVGEASCTSFHGANRLASNSLLECVVVGKELAEMLSEKRLSPFENICCKINCHISHYEKSQFEPEQDINQFKKKLRETMWEKVGIVRHEQGLKEALKIINELKLEFNQVYKCRTPEEYEFKSLLMVAEIITRSSLCRKESRGSHYRKDFPETNAEAQNSYVSKEKVCCL